jgi:hypothetical protein
MAIMVINLDFACILVAHGPGAANRIDIYAFVRIIWINVFIYDVKRVQLVSSFGRLLSRSRDGIPTQLPVRVAVVSGGIFRSFEKGKS